MCAVSYLNTVPLVWGMLHGAQRDFFDLSFALPAVCADRLASGSADIGIVPVAHLLRQELEIFRGAGIACRGPVRSILLVSKTPFREIRTLATDAGSRTSVLLARILLAQRYGAEPRTISLPADLPSMLEQAGAALLIGDPALRLDPAGLPFHTLDLGAEWTQMTGLPMVFAVWAGSKAVWSREREQAFLDSCRDGLAHLEDIARTEHAARGVTEAVARDYLTHNIAFELGEKDYEGMDLFLRYASQFDRMAVG
ncbi:MAG: menaquinone biosynthetic enzyme MqnA/MqnD family protein [Bryobacteraceae bacterium]